MFSKKMVVSTLLSAVLLLALMPFGAFAEEATPEEEREQIVSQAEGEPETGGESPLEVETPKPPPGDEPASTEIVPFAIPGSQQISAIFPDPGLAAAVAAAFSPAKSVSSYVTQADLDTLTEVTADEQGVTSLSGIDNLPNLTSL